MDDLIRIYNKALSNEYCDYLIDKFEKNVEQQERIGGIGRSFSQIDMMLENDSWSEDLQKIMPTFVNSLNTYIEDCKIDEKQWPSKYSWEGLRIKRYLSDGNDQFDTHVDVQNYKNANRFLTFFIYLNDNEGGKTSFSQLGKYADCKKGDILIFPPMWPWLHSGEKPIEKPKYILHSYLLYVWPKDG
tara:strand:- start:45 stop:605 length:561 start_codon:yes stop_codon:yes gene_type:complete